MTKNKIYLVLAIIFVMAFLGSFSENVENSIVVKIISIPLAIFFIYKYNNPKKKSKETPQQEETTPQKLICPKCGNENITYQVLNEVKFKNKGRGCFYWLLIGWWLEIILWLFLTIPRLLFLLFGGKRQRAINITKRIAVCQNCGNDWKI